MRSIVFILAFSIAACAAIDNISPEDRTPRAVRQNTTLHDAVANLDPLIAERIDWGELEGFVLVRDDAHVYSRADYDSEVGWFGAPDEPRVGGALIARVVADHGEFVEVETVTEELLEHCYSERTERSHRRSVREHYAIRGYVERYAILPVVQETWTETFDDGTAVTIGTGTAVGSAGSARTGYFVASTGENSPLIELPLPVSHIGYSYIDVEPDADAGSGNFGRTHVGTLDGQTTWLSSNRRHIDEFVELGDATFATVGDRCIRMTLQIDPHRATFMDSVCGGVRGLNGRNMGTFGYSIAPGSAAFWPDGEVAGVMRAGEPLAMREPNRIVGDLICFDLPYQSANDGSLNGAFEICHESADVTQTSSIQLEWLEE